jgi:hypothetical protein
MPRAGAKTRYTVGITRQVRLVVENLYYLECRNRAEDQEQNWLTAKRAARRTGANSGCWGPQRLVPDLGAVFAVPFCPGARGEAAIKVRRASSRCSLFAVFGALPVHLGSVSFVIIASMAT